MSAEPEVREKEENLFKDVSEAYSVLSDTKKKNRYDSGQDLDEFEMPGELHVRMTTKPGARTNFPKPCLKSENPLIIWMFLDVPYPRERGPTTECPSTPHFGLNFLLRPSVYSNMRPCVAALENAAQMAGL